MVDPAAMLQNKKSKKKEIMNKFGYAYQKHISNPKIGLDKRLETIKQLYEQRLEEFGYRNSITGDDKLYNQIKIFIRKAKEENANNPDANYPTTVADVVAKIGYAHQKKFGPPELSSLKRANPNNDPSQWELYWMLHSEERARWQALSQTNSAQSNNVRTNEQTPCRAENKVEQKDVEKKDAEQKNILHKDISVQDDEKSI